MNYIREAENILWYYNDLYRSVENMNREIAKLVWRQGPSGLNGIAISMEPTGVHGSGGQDDNTYNLLYKLKVLSENREKTITELSRVDDLLDEISRESGCELYGRVLKEWYVYRTPKEEIAKRIGYANKRSVYQIKDRAIRKFAVRQFGLEAMRVV